MRDEDFLAMNREAWDQRTRIHVASRFYDVEGFLAGRSSLNEIELEEVGAVEGDRLLHLQCHFGLDTLSWARRGAIATGVDLSEEAIREARALANRTGLDATFVTSDVYAFGETNQSEFDVVFASYGALCWLPDLDRWATVVAGALRPGGRAHLIEFHPAIDLVSGYSYFPSEEPNVEQEETYTENSGGEETTIVTWPHSIAEVLGAFIEAGLRIESFREYPWSPYDCFEGLERAGERRYELRSDAGELVPLVYAVSARKMGNENEKFE